MMQFNCEPSSANPGARALAFTWDPDTGEIGGRDAALVISMAVPRQMVPAHPYPWGVRLGTRPRRSWRDMALIVGFDWVLPEDMARHYPKPPPTQDFRDSSGRRIEVTF